MNTDRYLCARTSCTGNSKGGFCRILKSTYFGYKLCPFYKTDEQNEKEKKAVIARLIAMDRQDLIETYYSGKEGGVQDGC